MLIFFYLSFIHDASVFVCFAYALMALNLNVCRVEENKQ